MKKIIFKLSLAVLLMVLYMNLTKAQPFVEQSGIVLMGIYNCSVAWGDYDNDNDLDILLTGTDKFEIGVSVIYRNNGDNSFTEQANLLLSGNIPGASSWGDYDNDGDLDVLISYQDFHAMIPITSIYRNNGNNTFTEQTDISFIGVERGSVAWGDYDNDGFIDIVVTGNSNAGNFIFRIYHNNGNNTFAELTDLTINGISDGSVTWGDYDNDDDLDILISGENAFGFTTKIIRNDDNNIFTEQNSIPLIGLRGGSVAWGDYDNDGDLDILLTGQTPSWISISKVYRNNGNNSFTDQTGSSLTGVKSGSAIWGDYDNDGDLDILITGSETDTNFVSKIYSNNGDGTFIEQTGILITALTTGSIAWGDYDNDGDLDILSAGLPCNACNNSNIISKVFRNETSQSNTLPITPTNLTSLVFSNRVNFSWNKSTDAETSSNGLSYNIRISSISDSLDLKSPMANLNSGFRKIATIGNTCQTNFWSLQRELAFGLYYWSVQSIDNNFAGSPFATEQTFLFPIRLAVTNDTSIFCRQSIQINAQILNNFENKPLSYSWSPVTGLNNPNISNPVANPDSTTTYTVSVTDGIYSKTESITLTIVPQSPPHLFLISYDTLTGKNILVWEKPQNIPLEYYNIYKANSSSQFTLLAIVSYDQNSSYTDTSATPASEIGRYKITVIDSCGVETDYSTEFRSIKLSVSSAGSHYTLFWNTPTGLSFSEYEILRGTSLTNMQPVYFLDNTATSWTDYSPPGCDVYYQLRIIITGCSDGNNSYTQVLSNKVNNGCTPITGFTITGNNEFCEGSTSILSATAGLSNYIWSTGATSDQITVSSSGNYSITVSNNCGCSAIGSFSVTAYQEPDVTIIPQGPTSFCQGNSVILLTIADTNYTYQWKRNGLNIIGATNNSYEAIMSGYYSVLISTISGCSKTSTSVPVISNPLPAANLTVTGDTVFCQGNFAQLFVGTGTGYFYQWYKNGTTVSNAVSSSYMVFSTGAYSVQITDMNNCIKISDTISILANPIPDNSITFSGPVIFCEGGSVTISVTNNTNYSYQWKNNGLPVSGALYSQFTATQNGYYNVYISDNSNGCSSTSSSTLVALHPNPIPDILAQGNIILCLNDSIHLSTINAYNSYQWSNGSTSQNAYFKQAGVASVFVTDQNGCSGKDSLLISEEVISAPAICIVSVDSVTGKNVIKLENISSQIIDNYFIYKETSANNYVLIGSVPYSINPEYIDYFSTPDVNQNRYKASTVDTCGNITDNSPFHQTINLSVAQGSPPTTVILLWSEYLDQSGIFEPDYYYIYKGSSLDNLSLYDSVSGTTHIYNDLNVYNIYYYKITIRKTCGLFNESQSNIKSSQSSVGINRITYEANKLNIAPNPFNEHTIISIPENNQHVQSRKIIITDISGKVVFEESGITDNLYKLNRGNLQSGVYFVELRCDKVFRGKLIIE